MKGRSHSGTTGLGIVEVNGRSRVPSPPARTRACKLPADSLVGEPGRPDGVRVDAVASVDDDLPRHPLRRGPPIELPELGPFGDDDAGVRLIEGVERRAS